ncbi:MAG TPA: dienelactone hydrolase family protein [Candidatus Saccharimonadales bacterium]
MGKMIQVQGDEVVDAYLATPMTKPKGAIIVVHEVWGLVKHTKDVADRLAAEGYVALAPDLLKELDFGSTDVAQMQKDLFNPETRNKVQPELRKLMTPIHDPSFGAKTLNRLEACFNFLYDDEQSSQKVGIIGFCFGGTYSYALAVNETRLKLVLPFYGHADQSADQLSNITCPVRAFYGKNDSGLIDNLPDLKARMAEAKVDFKDTVYDNCGHAFFNDTNPYAYNKQAAEAAWVSVLEELNNSLN